MRKRVSGWVPGGEGEGGKLGEVGKLGEGGFPWSRLFLGIPEVDGNGNGSRWRTGLPREGESRQGPKGGVGIDPPEGIPTVATPAQRRRRRMQQGGHINPSGPRTVVQGLAGGR